jgi:hypothetical protein
MAATGGFAGPAWPCQPVAMRSFRADLCGRVRFRSPQVRRVVVRLLSDASSIVPRYRSLVSPSRGDSGEVERDLDLAFLVDRVTLLGKHLGKSLRERVDVGDGVVRLHGYAQELSSAPAANRNLDPILVVESRLDALGIATGQ